MTSPPAQRSEVGGVGRQAGGGPATCSTERRSNNTRVPPFTRPLPISLPLARPPPTSLGEEVFITSPPAQRSEVGGVGRRPGEGRPRIALNAVPITPASRRSPAPSRSRCRSLDLPQLRWGRRFL